MNLQVSHVPRFCGAVPRANPPQSVQRLERPSRAVRRKRCLHVGHLVVVRHATHRLTDGLRIGRDRRGRCVVGNLRCTVIIWVIGYIIDKVSRSFRTLMPSDALFAGQTADCSSHLAHSICIGFSVFGSYGIGNGFYARIII